jgi:XTP/dITP diphosphohydrolase
MNSQLKGRFIFFVTNNVNKFNEARRVLAEYKMSVGMLRIKSPEIQSNSLKEIAKASVTDAFEKCKLPTIVEDAGLFVDGLNGFPGPYAAYIYKTIGNQGMLKLMENIETRKAQFESVVAYLSSEIKSPICFNGIVAGEIAAEERRGSNKSGFGFDPIFKLHGKDKTFAEMNVEEKNQHSHRAKAFRKFARWCKKL